jgi:hypothetical protein
LNPVSGGLPTRRYERKSEPTHVGCCCIFDGLLVCQNSMISFQNLAGGSSGLDSFRAAWEIPKMKTLTVDDQKRIRIPDAKPRQVFAYENFGDGRLTLTLVKAEAQEPFPPGSLKKYVTPERDAEMLDLLKGCSLEVPD